MFNICSSSRMSSFTAVYHWNWRFDLGRKCLEKRSGMHKSCSIYMWGMLMFTQAVGLDFLSYKLLPCWLFKIKFIFNISNKPWIQKLPLIQPNSIIPAAIVSIKATLRSINNLCMYCIIMQTLTKANFVFIFSFNFYASLSAHCVNSVFW